MLSALDCSSTAARHEHDVVSDVELLRVSVKRGVGFYPFFFFNPFTARVSEVVLTFTFVDKILCCDHSNEISLEVLSCGVICFKKFYKMKSGIFVQFAFGHIWQ